MRLSGIFREFPAVFPEELGAGIRPAFRGPNECPGDLLCEWVGPRQPCDTGVTVRRSVRHFRVVRTARTVAGMDDQPADPTAQDDNPEAYVGLPGEDAETAARERGWLSVRSLPPGAMVTMEYREGRLNFTVENGVVVRCWKG